MFPVDARHPADALLFLAPSKLDSPVVDAGTFA
jgi:hypothetical protein